MSLARFSIIVAVDKNGGISCNGSIPWNSSSDMKYFRDTTVGNGHNAIIMGRVTYETIPIEFRPLRNRTTFVISRTWVDSEHQGITVCDSLERALSLIGESIRAYENVFIAGGEQIYSDVVEKYMYLCDRVIITRFKTDHNCDQFFPLQTIQEAGYEEGKPYKTMDYVRLTYKPNVAHQEYKYIDLCKRILLEGEEKTDRTGTGTRSLFGTSLDFDISEEFPILTTKKVLYEKIFKELLFFISGETDTNILVDDGVNFWKGNTSRGFLDERGLGFSEGSMGKGYGFQWRHWGSEIAENGLELVDPTDDPGIDQLQNVIEQIRNNAHSRRHLVSAWNVGDLDEMALPPCHYSYQFNVSGDGRHLDCQLNMRSADVFLGLPFNITSYAALTYMVAHICGLKPRRLRVCMGDTHIYLDHIDKVRRQVKRTPKPWCNLRFRNSSELNEIDDFKYESFIVEDYTSWPFISGKMSV